MTRGQSVQLKRRFLEHFRRHGNVSAACQESGIARRAQVYEWQEHDETFAAAYKQAEVEATETMEREAYRRAVEGTVEETPIVHRGAIVGTTTVTRYSDTLLIFMLKARAPEKYRDRHDFTSGGEKIDLASLVLLAADKAAGAAT